MKRFFCDHVDFPAKKVFQVLPKSNVIQQTAPFLERNKEIDIAFARGFASGNRPKNTHVFGPMLRGDFKYFMPFFA